MFELVHAGFDTLDVAIQGALPEESLEALKAAREEANESQESVLLSLGPNNIAMHVAGHGMRGGYAFLVDTGPVGFKVLFKNNSDPRQWNIFASARATTLLAYGYHGTRDRLWELLHAIDAIIVNHSVNRVDFAMDFLTMDFELSLDRFVAHSHTKVRPYWGDMPPRDDNQPTAVLRGRRLESVTIGKMPGRQIIVYDKKREVIERKKHFWFREWGLEPTNRENQVWRVEVRAGKKDLKSRWNIRRCEDVESRIGDVVRQSLRDVRFVADKQSDSNVSRQHLHPLWNEAQSVADQELVGFQSGIGPGQIIEIERQVAMDQYTSLVVGNAIGMGVSQGYAYEQIRSLLPDLVAMRLESVIRNDSDWLNKAVGRTRARLHFIN